MVSKGYLVKYGSYPIPNNFIRLDTYTITPNMRIDLDSYRDADAYLQRTVLQHTLTKIEFETPAMYEDDMEVLMSHLRANYENYFEKCGPFTYYDPENNIYKTGRAYIPDFTYKMYSIAFGKIIYRPTRIAFIEY